jgi:hypothetical protein
MQCRSLTNFLRWQEWSVQFERCSVVRRKFCHLINNATEPSLHLVRVMLNEAAPARFCAVAFGLMACTACRHGFTKMSLFAGGDGPPAADLEKGDLIGYFVWPKFGFDAPLLPVDLNMAPDHIRDCTSILGVVEADLAWWEAHGRGREMYFDLAADSASWKVLLDYLYTVLFEDDNEHQENA